VADELKDKINECKLIHLFLNFFIQRINKKINKKGKNQYKQKEHYQKKNMEIQRKRSSFPMKVSIYIVRF
jgi:hypothetical protein